MGKPASHCGSIFEKSDNFYGKNSLVSLNLLTFTAKIGVLAAHHFDRIFMPDNAGTTIHQPFMKLCENLG